MGSAAKVMVDFCGMFGFVPWNRCKICSTPNAREIVDGLLDAGTELRVVSAKLALLDPPVFIDKSSIHRHSKKCYSVRERALRRKEQSERAKADARLRVVRPGNSPAIGGPHDVLILVVYEEGTMRNPQTVARQAPEEIPAAEEAVPERKKSSLIGKIKNLFHPKASALPAVEAKLAETPDPPPPAPCPHTRQRQTPSGKQCDDCGKMLEAVFAPVGAMSRKDFFARANRFGRFG